MSAQVRTIEIDFDVHKAIETERTSFSETPNDVLRRMLKINRKKPQLKKLSSGPNTGTPWFGKGVELPHGTLLKSEYNGRVHEGEIINGRWFVEGHYFTSPSGAMGVARTKNGAKPQLDGWIYWKVKRPEDSYWKSLNNLRY